MSRLAASVVLSVAIGLTGCATTTDGKPYLTQRAFDRAAAACNVVPQGMHHSRGSKVPFANYKLGSTKAAAEPDHSHECLATALTKYRYDFFGEVDAPDRQ